MNPALLVIVLLSAAAAQPACDTGEQCDASTLVGGDGDPALSLLQHEALLKKKINVHGRDDGEVEGEVEVPELSLLELAEQVGLHQTQASTASLLTAVQEMAEQDAKGELHADKITEQVLKTIIENMEKKVIGAALASHKEDQNEVNRAHKAIDTCKANMDDHFSKSGGINSLKTATETAKSTLTACKTQMATMNSTQQTDCTSFENWVAGGLYNSRPSCVCSLPKTPSASVLTCINQAKSWGTTSSGEYKKMRDSCDSSTTDLTSKHKECDNGQSTFESAFCSYGLLLTTTCQDYDKCYAEKGKTYTTVIKDVKVDEASRKAEFEAAKHVICFVGVLKAKAADKKKELTACKGKTYSTAQLDMTYPTASSKATCDVSPVASKPCDASFISTHYSAAWSTLAPVKKCTPCTAWPTPGGGGGGAVGTFTCQKTWDGGCGNFGAKTLNKKFEDRAYTISECAQKCKLESGCAGFFMGTSHKHCLLSRAGCWNDKNPSYEYYDMSTCQEATKDTTCAEAIHKVPKCRDLPEVQSCLDDHSREHCGKLRENPPPQCRTTEIIAACNLKASKPGDALDLVASTYSGSGSWKDATNNYEGTIVSGITWDSAEMAFRTGGNNLLGNMKIMGMDISPSKYPSLTMTVEVKLNSYANNRGWLVTQDNGGYDRSIIVHDNRYGSKNGVGFPAAACGTTFKFVDEPLPLNKWVTLTGVWNQGGDSYLFVDTKKSKVKKSTHNSGGRANLWIGGYPGYHNHRVDGWFRSLKVWGKALTDTEVAAMLAPAPAPSAAPAPAPVQAFHLDAQGKACKNYHTASIEPGAAERYSATDNCLSLDRSQCEARCRTTPNCVTFQSPNNEAKSKAAGACNCYLFAAGQCSQQSSTFYSIWNQA